MSLDFNLTKIKDYKTVCYQEFKGTREEMEARMQAQTFFSGWRWSDDGQSLIRLHPTTEALIFSTMTIMIGEITEKNWKDVLLRLRMYESTFEALRLQGEEREPVFFTAEEVKAHIGLKVNVKTESTAKFNGNMVRVIREQAQRSLAKEAK